MRRWSSSPSPCRSRRIRAGTDLCPGNTFYVGSSADGAISERRRPSGTVSRSLTDPDLDAPTTMTRQGSRLYVVNARLRTPTTPTTPYWITKLQKPPGL